jgi:manganese/zinc/iron transport system substrate-binding protein
MSLIMGMLGVLGVLLVGGLLSGCGGGETSSTADQPTQGVPAEGEPAPEEATPPTPTPEPALTVVATTGHVGDAVSRIGGDVIEVITLLGPGIDPHTYVPTEGDIAKFEAADVILYNGLKLELQMEEIIKQLGQSRNIPVQGIGDTLDESRLLSWEPEAGLAYDPHIWNDVALWRDATRAVSDTLVAADPAHADTYRANAEAYFAELDELDSFIAEQIATIPEENRVLVTAHDAFNYFGRAYDLRIEAIQGISTETEASTADIQALADLIVELQVPAIFAETMVSPRTVEALRAAVQSRGMETIKMGGNLYSDALGEPGSGVDSYIAVMRHNTEMIVNGLGGSAAGKTSDTSGATPTGSE